MKFVVKNRNISCERSFTVGDNKDYIAEFSFDEEWEGKTKTARFEISSGHVDVVLTDDSCTIPVDVLKKGVVKVGVFESNMTTTVCDLIVKESIKEKDGDVIPPTEDVYAEIIEKLDEKQNTLTAGSNISILGNTISAEVPTKTSELTNDSNFITSDYHDATKQNTLVAGENITIEGNTISASGGSGSDLDVQINGTSIVSEGVANIPKANENQFGVVKTGAKINSPVYINDVGYLRVSDATSDYVDNRNIGWRQSAVVTTGTLDYAVKSALCDGKGASWSEAEKLKARERLGLEKEFVLKGTLTTDIKDSGVTLDLSGCTEMIVKGSAEATSNISMRTNIGLIIYNAFTTTNRKSIYAKYVDSQFGFDCIFCKCSGAYNSSNLADNGSGYCYTNTTKLSRITKVYFDIPSAITECNIEIYAR